ncbi:GGDEF domain-containing protein [Cryptosporangium sp. NPDC051539]|uniref:GGDEF domain-containing protein n=1 Tax=Cryptosporangium sp. NPDC051539 TaxID=3363962 RepID=UPI0037B4A6BD
MIRLVRTDPVVRLAAIGGLYWVAVFTLVNWLAQEPDSVARLVVNVLFLVPIAVATVTAGVAAARRRRTASRTGRAWAALTLSYLFWLVGEVFWVGYVWIEGPEVAYPSAADGLFLAQYLIVIPAFVIAFGQGHRSRRGRVALDVSLVMLGLGALGWRVLVAPVIEDVDGLSRVVTALYPLSDIVVLGCLLTLGLSGQRRLPVSLRLAGWSYLVYTVTDCLYLYGRIQGTYDDGSWLDTGYQVAAVLLALGGLVALRHDEPDAVRLTAGRDLTVVPLLATGLSALVMVTLEHAFTGGYRALALAAIVLAGLMVRQHLVTRDRTDLARQLTKALREQKRLAVTDALTGLFNRRYFDDMLRSEVARARRSGRPLSLVVLDLDHFKRINDDRGHHAGDAALVQAAARLKAVTRDADVVARFGGEEFVWLLPDTDEAGAAILAERLRSALADRPVEIADGDPIPVTGSLGVACAIGLVDDEILIRDADRAMYHAKATGRNRVALASTIAPAVEEIVPTGSGVADLCREVGTRLGLDAAEARLVEAAGRVAALNSPVLSLTDRTARGPVAADDPGTLVMREALAAPGVHPDSQRIVATCLAWIEARAADLPPASRTDDQTVPFDASAADDLAAAFELAAAH